MNPTVVMPQMISANQKAVSQPWCFAIVLNGSPDRKPPTEHRIKTYTSKIQFPPAFSSCIQIQTSTYCWPSRPRWHVTFRSSWKEHSHWLWLQTRLLVHKRKNQKQLLRRESTPGGTQGTRTDVYLQRRASEVLGLIRYLWAVSSDCDSEQVHGGIHARHHADQDKVARIAVNLPAML